MEMPGLGGLVLVELLRKQFPLMRLVVVSTHEGPVWQQLSETRGANAFVTKRRLDAELADLVQRLFPGRGVSGPMVAQTGATG
jgi:DNA-binding NarL/FixJ family response regulator